MIKTYTVISPKRMMKVKDDRVSRRNCLPERIRGMILIDDSTLKKINFDCEIALRKNHCWELFITDEKTAKRTKTIAKRINAIAFMEPD